MRCSLVLNDTLLEEARRALGTVSIRDTIETALRQAIRTSRLEELRRSLGTMDLDLTPEDLARVRDAG